MGKLSNKGLQIIALGVAVFFAAISVGTGGIITIKRNSENAIRASVGTDIISQNDYARYYTGGYGANALFGTDGLNFNAASKLMSVLNSVGTTGTRDAGHFSNFATANDNDGIAQVNGGVYIRLFEPINDTTTLVNGGTTLLNNFTTSNNVVFGTVGKARWWRAVYMRDNVLTLYMAEPYRDTQFGVNNTYSTSTARSNMIADYNSVVSKYNSQGQSAINTAVIPAGNNKLAYIQINQGDTQPTNAAQYHALESVGNSAPVTGDKIWLPAWFETANMTQTRIPDNHYIGSANASLRLGQWNVNSYDLGFEYSSFSVASWLRSRMNGNNEWIAAIKYFGHNNCNYFSDICSVRPAIHIDVANIAAELAAHNFPIEYDLAGVSATEPDEDFFKNADIFPKTIPAPTDIAGGKIFTGWSLNGVPLEASGSNWILPRPDDLDNVVLVASWQDEPPPPVDPPPVDPPEPPPPPIIPPEIIDEIGDELEKTIDEIGGEQGNYTDESWKKYQDAIKHLEDLLADSNATIEQLVNALNELRAARDGLVRDNSSKSDFTPLFIGIAIGALLVLLGGIFVAFLRRREKDDPNSVEKTQRK